MYIEGPNGNQLLVDGGPPSGAVLRELGKVMPFFDRSIDVVMESHPDQDHIGGLPEVFSRFQVAYFIEPGIVNDTAATVALTNAVEQEGAQDILARRDMVIDLGSGVRARVLFPDRGVEHIETNTGSIVVRLEYGSTSVLLTGDSPVAIESYLVSLDAEGLQSTILKLGHHGSRTSSSKEYLEAVHPEVAIVSAGKDNQYGHPHQEVLDTLATLKIPYRSTAEEGTLRFVSDGKTFTQK